MSLAHRYAELSPYQAAGAEGGSVSEPLEDFRLEAFENGYRAGWDDAVKACEGDETRLAADLRRGFQDLSFTFLEAQSKLSQAMAPLMHQVIEKMLPVVAQETLGQHVVEQIQKLVTSQGSDAIEIAVSPASKMKIETVLEGKSSPPFAIVAEPALTEGQVYIRVGSAEREVDLDAVIDGISKAFDAFFHDISKEQVNG
ncbi:MAG: flagellar biosynthesis protein [Sulfitobacter sp.]